MACSCSCSRLPSPGPLVIPPRSLARLARISYTAHRASRTLLRFLRLCLRVIHARRCLSRCDHAASPVSCPVTATAQSTARIARIAYTMHAAHNALRTLHIAHTARAPTSRALGLIGICTFQTRDDDDPSCLRIRLAGTVMRVPVRVRVRVIVTHAVPSLPPPLPPSVAVPAYTHTPMASCDHRTNASSHKRTDELSHYA